MSRGGRGGGFGGRGGRQNIPGVSQFGDDIKPDYSVTELFPPNPPPVQSSLTKEERAMVSRFRSHRDKIHTGPFYTVLAPRTKGTTEDPFNNISRYSEKYQRKPRKAPKLDSRPYVVEFFPEELHATLGVEKSEDGKIRKKTLVVTQLDELLDMVAEDGAEDKEEDKEDKEEEDKGVESEQDPDQLTDDDEGDYNAEQYFSGGDDISDVGDDDDGGFY
ncbi:DNA-directed RNA polymerase III, subunit Rpc31 [Pyronema omphalodes]|nr:DNA-directed RNA polymerase III, subunit Rpc31 [Pyronema omphalodes]